MARIKFVSDQVYDTGGPGQGPKFDAGQIVDGSSVAKLLGMKKADEAFVAAWLQRWVSRGVADYVADTPKAAIVAPPASAAPPPTSDPAPAGDLSTAVSPGSEAQPVGDQA